MRLPLYKRMKMRLHRKIAMLQDEIVDIVYSIEPKAVLHGGTVIWRCYFSNRFSEDLDFYIGEASGFKEKFFSEINTKDLRVEKYKKTKNTLFSRISSPNAVVQFEAALRKPKHFVVADYERLDGNYMSVFTLTPEKLLLEKIEAYKNRRLVRDIYDVFVLSSFAELNESLKTKAREFLKSIEKPRDEKTLKALIFSGAVPSFKLIKRTLKRRFK